MNGVAAAESIARSAHDGAMNQHDGEPYIRHVERVAAHLAAAGASEKIQMVGWLHDVVEDTHLTLDDLLTLGFPPDVVDAVDCITHRRGESREDYYQRVGSNRMALAAKMADIRDNTDPTRKENLATTTRERLRAKYEKAHRALIPHLIRHLERDRQVA